MQTLIFGQQVCRFHTMQIPINHAGTAHPNHPGLNRRKFLQHGTGLLALAAMSPHRLLAKTTCDLNQVHRSMSGLGTTITLKALHTDTDKAQQAIDAAFEELKHIEATLSIYRQDSQISQLNRQGVVHHPDKRLLEVLEKSADWSRKTKGSFDITVQPLWALYQATRKEKSLPDSNSLDQARQLIDWRQLEFNKQEVRLNKKGAAVTLNGIAQGYATDRVQGILKEHEIEHALIDCGEIGPLGSNIQGNPWTVGIQHPRQSEAFSALAQSDGRAIATSGDYATTFSPDFQHNHLFDPHTGHSPEELASVTVAAPTATDADALSTAISVMGLDEGLALIQTLKQCDALLVTKSGRTLMTEGFPCKA